MSIPKDASRQRNIICDKCKRDIKQEFNEKLQNFQYAETFRKKRIKLKTKKVTKYYCNECFNKV